MNDYLNYVHSNYPIRRSKEEKESFRKYVLEEANKLGLESSVETIKEHNNVIIGNHEKAKVIFTAHYDTPARAIIPNLIFFFKKLIGF